MTAKQLTLGLSGCVAAILVAAALGAGTARAERPDDRGGTIGIGAIESTSSATSALDARERSLLAKRDAQLGGGGSLGWFERVAAAHSLQRGPVVDDRFRIDATETLTPRPAASGDERDWPQLGLSFALGALLVALAWIAARLSSPRRIAH